VGAAVLEKSLKLSDPVPEVWPTALECRIVILLVSNRPSQSSTNRLGTMPTEIWCPAGAIQQYRRRPQCPTDT
jgi:hypothetical protein